MQVVTNPTDDVVSTDDRPIISRGLDVELDCRNCGHVFHLSDADRDVPIGHKKWTKFTCPECGGRVAREKGTNRAFEEDYVDMTVDDVFAAKHDDADDYELIVGSEVDPDDVGDTVVDVFEYYPHSGITNRLSVDGDDVIVDDHGAVDHDDIPAAVEWYDGYVKPIGYPAEWENDPETERESAARDCDSVLRFVRRVEA